MKPYNPHNNTCLRLMHLYPEQLNLYGDRGNVLALQHRARVHGYTIEITELEMGFCPDLRDYDLLFMGGGQDINQSRVAEDLLRYKQAPILNAAQDSVVLLAICGAYQLLGKNLELFNGDEMEGLGLFDVETRRGHDRLIGNFCFTPAFPFSASLDGLYAPRWLLGFENHSSRSYLATENDALGHILKGKGNNGEDTSEGVRRWNCFGSYAHGAFLPRNPQMTDHLLSLALSRRRGKEISLPLLNISWENEARRALVRQMQLTDATV